MCLKVLSETFKLSAHLVSFLTGPGHSHHGQFLAMVSYIARLQEASYRKVEVEGCSEN